MKKIPSPNPLHPVALLEALMHADHPTDTAHDVMSGLRAWVECLLDDEPVEACEGATVAELQALAKHLAKADQVLTTVLRRVGASS